VAAEETNGTELYQPVLRILQPGWYPVHLLIMTPVQRLADYVRSRYETTQVFENLVSNLIEKEKRELISFHKWMLQNDTADNAEAFANYSDKDMVDHYLNQHYETAKKNT
jgi:hypothetical protein